MPSQAGACVTLLGPSTPASTLSPIAAQALLTALRGRGLSVNTVRAYYSAFRQAMSLNGVSTATWPKVPTPPVAKPVERLDIETAERLHEWLLSKRWFSTADVLVLLRGTGYRLTIKAVTERPMSIDTGDEYDTLCLVNVGGRARTVPVVDAAARTLVRDATRLSALRHVSTRTHQRRWATGLLYVGIT